MSGYRVSGRRIAGWALMGCLLLAGPGRAAVEDLSAFARLPVQEGGRVMPMDSYARLKLLQLSGRSTQAKQPASAWLAKLLFTPEQAFHDEVLLVNHPEVLEALGVVAGEGRRYAFDQLKEGMDPLAKLAEAAARREPEQRSPVEKEILRIHESLVVFLGLHHAFAFARPHADFAVTNAALRARIGLPAGENPATFLDVFRAAPSFAAEVQALTARAPETWTDEERELFRLSAALYQWSQFYRDLPIALLPLAGHDAGEWVSPWDILGLGLQMPSVQQDLFALQGLARAYVAGDQAAFDQAAQALGDSVLARAPPSRSLRHLDLELLYNRADPFYRAQLLYGLTFLGCLVAMMTGSRWLRRLMLAGVVAALLPHTLGLIWRMLIMGRPPMTNLYATFLFVAWMCVLLGIVLELLQRNALGTLLASVSGLALLLVAGRFSSQGDTLGVVVAVLDSNFWLATHVVTITMGYAGCMAAGLAGHVYLLQALRLPEGDRRRQATARAIYGLLAFGLIFSFLGTMLGGVWADQSWGRFWGWDPKENGALLIVLWCAILFHARLAGMIGPTGMAAGSVLGIIVVLMAWIGINLLGVGLHSYGFTSGLARGLWTAVAFEVSFVAATLILADRRRG